ncbi:hypothetical protein CXB51_024625 [Gossypium anomalum]|uniref:DUF7745 domain-containing protein n=1 Tax=Gossypium anomalum TaxID=47600 RepID=A0A8J5YQF1_9ROSI|nr:hypothetical protein CXB51_024625 [Gossypium anomalum]
MKGDSLVKGCISNLPEQIATNIRQNNLEDLTQIWKQWDSETRGIFTGKYGDIAHLIAVKVDEQLIQAMVRFWDPAYQCFIFNHEDMTPTIKEYDALLRIDNVQFNKIYVKEPKPMTFKKKLVRLTGIIDIWAEKHIKKKNGISCIPWFSLRKGEGRFIGCAQLLNVWILSHFWKVERTPFHMFSKTFVLLKAYLEKDWPKDVTEQHWVSIFQNLRTEDITWRAPWICPSVLIYKCGSQDWVPLLRLWGGIGYAPLMIQRQFASRQFILATRGLAQSEFAFTGEGYMKRVRDTAKAWKKIHLMELALYADTITQDYDIWRKQRVNSQQVSSTNYTFQNPFSEETPSELESQTVKIQREAEIVRNNLRDLHLENKKLRNTIKNSGLGKSSVEWKEELSNIKGGMEFWKGKAKKEEEKAARAMIELRKKNAEYEIVSAEFLDTFLKALEEKNDQYERDTRAYERALQEKKMQLGFLIIKIRNAAMQIMLLLDEAEALSCQLPPNQRSSISEFLEQVKKQGEVARKFV